jgi:Ca-activated chloride channel homolog
MPDRSFLGLNLIAMPKKGGTMMLDLSWIPFLTTVRRGLNQLFRLQFFSPATAGYTLAILVVLSLILWGLRWRQKKNGHGPSGVLVPGLRPKARPAVHLLWKLQFGNLMRLCVLLIGIFAMARPQGPSELFRHVDGHDIMLVVDTSGSMKARDFVIDGERPTRLEVIKKVIAEFIDSRPNDRIGLVVFGTEAFTQAPLTLDHDVLISFLNQIEIGMAGEATAIGDGLATAVNRLKDFKEDSKTIILLTDGANNAGRFDPEAATQSATAFKIRVHTIGVGSEGEIPIVSNGQVIYTRVDIDEKMMTKISAATGGVYRRAKDSEALRGIYQEIDRLERRAVDDQRQLQGRDYFTWPIAFMLLLFFLEMLWRLTKWRVIP